MLSLGQVSTDLNCRALGQCHREAEDCLVWKTHTSSHRSALCEQRTAPLSPFVQLGKPRHRDVKPIGQGTQASVSSTTCFITLPPHDVAC